MILPVHNLRYLQDAALPESPRNYYLLTYVCKVV